MWPFDYFQKKKQAKIAKVAAEQEEIRRQQSEKERLAQERETRLREHKEQAAKLFEANTKKFRILNFYLDCSHYREQEQEIKKCPLALPIVKVDVEEESRTIEKYKVNSLPKLILVDFNGKEIMRWKGITPTSEINEFLYANGYAERPIEEENEDNERFMEIEKELAAQFVVESMIQHFNYEPQSEISDDANMANFQVQYKDSCLKAKSVLAMGIADKDHPFAFVSKGILQNIIEYINIDSNRYNQAMKYLYNCDDENFVFHQISMLTFFSCLKNLEDVNDVPRDIFGYAMNPDTVGLEMATYVLFTIMVNPTYKTSDFNKLFVESWYNYYNNFSSRFFMLRMRGNSWKDDFKGALNYPYNN